MSDESGDSTRRKHLGRRIRKARLGAGIDPATCARVLDWTPAQWEALENGEAELSLPHLEILSRVLGVPISYFWSEDIGEAGLHTPLPIPVLLEIRRRMIGVQLRQARLAAGKSLNECAERLGVRSETIADWEYGREDIPLGALEVLSDYLHVPLSYFADETILSPAERDQQWLERLNQLPADVREFVLKPANVLYVRLAMLLSGLSTETLRQLGEGLLDITL